MEIRPFHGSIKELPRRNPKLLGHKPTSVPTPSSEESLAAIEGPPLPWCFQCRTFSHLIKDCPTPGLDLGFGLDIITDDPSLDDFLHSLHAQFARDKHRDQTCKRCRDLYIPNLLNRPYQTLQPHMPESMRAPPLYGEAIDIAAWLGRGDGVQFLSNCPVCKMLLASALRFRPGSWRELYILRVITPFITTVKMPNRMDAVSLMMHEMGDLSGYKRSLFLTGSADHVQVHNLGIRMGISSYQQAPDGEAQANEFSCSLVTARPDYALIGSWIRGCVSNHPSCTPEHDMETLSRIRLVDVQDRMVVPYDPNISSHYVALSYVWGRVRQASVALWSPLPPLPATIEDAMTVVRTLGFRYLWVDSLCIDQESEEHKASQINIMASIYRSAYVTIINLSGTSALSGLSGVSIDRSISQFRCTLDESTILVSTLPALAAYTRQSPWSSRAWVLQEALLSRRKLFFTQSQVYFECAEYQTSEVLRAHLPTRPVPEDPDKLPNLLIDPEMPQGEFRIDFSTLASDGPMRLPSRRVAIYRSLLEEYKSRHLSFFSDSLNGFHAIVSLLSAGFGTEFRSGLPLCDFLFALAWRVAEPVARDPDFPSWSWAGYDGVLERGAATPPGYPDWQVEEDGRPFWVPWLKVEEMASGDEGEFVVLGEWQQEDGYRDPWKGMSGDIETLKVRDLEFEDVTGAVSLQEVRDGIHGPELLVIEGIVLTLRLKGLGGDEALKVMMGDGEYFMHTTTAAHAEEIWEKCGEQPSEYLLLYRAEYLEQVLWELLLLEWKNGVAYRVDHVEISVPAAQLAEVAKAMPKRKRFWFG